MAEGGDISFENPVYDLCDDPYDDDWADWADWADQTTPFIHMVVKISKCRQCNTSHLGCQKNLMSRPVLVGQKQVKWPGLQQKNYFQI